MKHLTVLAVGLACVAIAGPAAADAKVTTQPASSSALSYWDGVLADLYLTEGQQPKAQLSLEDFKKAIQASDKENALLYELLHEQLKTAMLADNDAALQAIREQVDQMSDDRLNMVRGFASHLDGLLTRLQMDLLRRRLHLMDLSNEQYMKALDRLVLSEEQKAAAKAIMDEYLARGKADPKALEALVREAQARINRNILHSDQALMMEEERRIEERRVSDTERLSMDEQRRSIDAKLHTLDDEIGALYAKRGASEAQGNVSETDRRSLDAEIKALEEKRKLLRADGHVLDARLHLMDEHPSLAERRSSETGHNDGHATVAENTPKPPAGGPGHYDSVYANHDHPQDLRHLSDEQLVHIRALTEEAMKQTQGKTDEQRLEILRRVQEALAANILSAERGAYFRQIQERQAREHMEVHQILHPAAPMQIPVHVGK